MPDNISLNIPVDIRTPGQYIEIDHTQAVSGIPPWRRRLLVLGQRLTTGAVNAMVPTRITSALQAAVAFGEGSMLARMCAAVFAQRLFGIDLWAVALNDTSGGVAAVKTITIAGTVSAAGTLALYVCGQRVQVAVGVAQSATDTAAAIVTEMARYPDLPVTATSALGVVTLTSRHKGETGNSIDIRHSYYAGEALPPGMTFTVATTTPGSGNPDITDALAAVDEEQYASIISPWTDSANMAALENELDARWGPMEQRTGHGFVALDDTFANLTTWGTARNSAHTSALGLWRSPTWTPERAAAWGAVVHYYGGIDPARPFQTLMVREVLAPDAADSFTRTERNLLLWDGISTMTAEVDRTVRIERVITTYQTRNGVPDPSLLDLNTKWTVDYIRYAVKARIALRFPRHKLANDGTRFAPGQAVATPRLIRAELVALMRELEVVGLVENIDEFKALLQVERSVEDVNRVNAIIPPNVVNQFLIFAAAVQFRL